MTETATPPEDGEKPELSAPPDVAGEDAPKGERADSWLKNSSRARDAASFGAMLEHAISELSGTPERRSGNVDAGVLIVGDVQVSGDLGAGDKRRASHRPGISREIIAGEITETALETIERSFIPPPVYERLRALLVKRRVVLLQAPSGWGRTTTGLRALHEMRPGSVRKLNPDTDLRDLNTGADLKSGCGHLLEVCSADQLIGLRVPHLEQLSAACVTHDAWVVVTVDGDIALDQELSAGFGVAGGERPDLDTVLRRHLELQLADVGLDDTAAAQVLADPRVEEIREKSIDKTISMHQLVELADRLSWSVHGIVDLDAIDAYFDELSETNFSQWFEKQDNTAQRAFLISLATLNGMPFADVSRAARLLEDRIRALEEGMENHGRPVFDISRTQRLESARAKTTSTTDHTRYGPVRVEGVRFTNDSYPGRVLERFWREYDLLRPIILDWLRALGADRSRSMGVRAAATAGKLATFDFDQLYHEVLLPWADSDDAGVRQNATAALHLPFTRNPDLAILVIRMVRGWSGARDHRNRRLTAARALGASIGQSMRPEAIRQLRRLAGRDDLELSFAVADSMLELFLATEENAQRDVLAALSRWTSDSAPPVRRSTGMLCFLQLALYVSFEDPTDRTVWPGPLWFASMQDDRLGQLGRLWHRAIAVPGHFMTAQSAFALWTAMAHDAPPIVEALSRLLTTAVRTRHDARRFTESVEQSIAEHGETEATEALLTTITELEKKL